MRSNKFNPYDPDAQIWAEKAGLGDKPWEQVDGEHQKAYAAFRVFCNMPPDQRTVLAAYRLQTGKPKATALPAAYARWVRVHYWFERAAFWDRYRDEQSREAELKKIRELGEQRATAYLSIMRAALVILQKSDLNSLTPTQARGMLPLITQFVDIGAKGNRLESGEPENRVQVDVVRKGPGKGKYSALGDDVNENELSIVALTAIAQSGNFQLPPDTAGMSVLSKK